MQKFTAFSILLSLIVVLATVDVLSHGYLSDGESAVIQEDATMDTPVDSTLDTEEPLATEEDPVNEVESIPSDTSDQAVELQEEEMNSWLTAEILTQAGFAKPVVKEALFSGLIFQIIPFNDASDTQTLQLNFFDGEIYVGTFYEVVYATETGSFQGYLSLREAAKTLTDLGTANEVNMYGDASFYFNHKTKVKTVHMVVLYGNRVLGFEYAQSEHEKMKKLFDILGTLQ